MNRPESLKISPSNSQKNNQILAPGKGSRLSGIPLIQHVLSEFAIKNFDPFL